MDPSRLALLFAVLAIAIGIGRFVLTTAGRAGDGMASLFVPPDRTLGWPRGVQESDEPWAWRGPDGAPSMVDPGGDGGDPGQPHAEPPLLGDLPHGSFVVPVDRVAPVHHGVRPH